MKLKGRLSESNTKQRNIDWSQCQAQILQDREQARVWAENHHLQEVHLVLAQEVTNIIAIKQGIDP